MFSLKYRIGVYGIGVTILAILVSSCMLGPKVHDSEKIASLEVVAENLEVPWSVTKVDNRFYISERDGTMLQIEVGDIQRQELFLSEEFANPGEGGLLGFILAPDFSETAVAYAYHTYRVNGMMYNRVIQLKKTEQGWEETTILLDHIPGHSIHNGGRLQIGPDNKLYVTTGDAGGPDASQDLNNLAGKILRMELNGEIPEDNPFSDSYIYSYGHRNPQGLAWNEDGSIMYSAEHGPIGHDEINIIRPGKNYGWPVIMGDEEKEGMEAPLVHSGYSTWAPSGIVYLEGKLYVAGLRGEQLLAFDFEAESIEVVVQDIGRIRDVFVHDGEIYIITNNRDGRGAPRATDDRMLKLK